MTEKERQILNSCGLFRDIPEQEVQQLLRCLHTETAQYARNEIIWRMGDPVHACAVILSGAVRAETVNAEGDSTLVAFHTSGALVGDVLMATPGGTSPVYVIAAEPASVLFVPYERLMDGCSRCCPCHSRLRRNLLSEIAGKFWAQRRRAGLLSVNGMRCRIAMYLRDRMQQAGSAAFSLGGTREDLADYLCVNRSALSRELGRMKAEGILDCRRDAFRILDPQALERAARGDI